MNDNASSLQLVRIHTFVLSVIPVREVQTGFAPFHDMYLFVRVGPQSTRVFGLAFYG
jgi:hypothetical protein